MSRNDPRTFIDQFIEEELQRDPEFRSAYEAELAAEDADRKQREALMADLVKLRKRRKIRQETIANALGVSQARISQIEHLTGGVSLQTVMGYARSVGAEIVVVPKDRVAEKRATFPSKPKKEN